VSRDVITYGPATLHALERELAEPITSPIANPAPIEHGPVMDYTVGDALGLRRMGEPATFAQPVIARSMRILAANLATAGALCRAYWYGRDYKAQRISLVRSVGMDATIRWDSAERWSWRPGCGRPMPGWER